MVEVRRKETQPKTVKDILNKLVKVSNQMGSSKDKISGEREPSG